MNQLSPLKPACLIAHQAILYNCAIDRNLFDPVLRRRLRLGGYGCELWLMPGAHAVRFEFGRLCATELVTDQEAGLPSAGVLSAFSCAGERDYEHSFGTSGASYLTTVQSEQLSDNLYQATASELRASAAETGALIHEWAGADGEGLSMVEVQLLAREAHIQTYHLLGGGLVLRTQSIFEHD
ncbi:MAG: DUF2617 family protein [Phycisphaerales bacterium JB039]